MLEDAQRGDHSSRSRIAPGLKQPTRGSERTALASETHAGWASPPLLFDLAPRGVFRAPDVATRAVGSYPTFSPLPNALDRKRRASGFAKGLPPRCKHHRRYIFCGTFRGRAARHAFAHLTAQPPGVTRRVALPWPTLASSPRLESGLSSRPLRLRETGRRSPDSPANNHYTLFSDALLQRVFSSFSNWDSSRMGTFRDLALSNFEPGSAPTTT